MRLKSCKRYSHLKKLTVILCQIECTVASHQYGKSVVRKDISIWEAYFLSFALKAAVFFQFDASLAYPETENFTKFGVTPAKSGNAPGGVLVGGTSNGPVAVKRSRHADK